MPLDATPPPSVTHTPQRYDYIDALRGYAIVAVIAFHASYAAPKLDPVVRQFLGAGSRGVQLFFVVSALTMMMSWRARSDGIHAFYTRRFFRIAPLFWLSIPVFLWLRGFSPLQWATNGASWGDVIATVFFVNGWHPESINNVVFGGWSVAVEMTFYLTFPVFVFFIRSSRQAAAAFLGSMALLCLFNALALRMYSVWEPSIPATQINQFIFYWFWNQLPVFFVGITVFFLLLEVELSPWVLNAGVLVAVLLAASITFAIDSRFEHVLYSLCFGLLAFCLAKGGGRILVNRVICHIGKVSFSAYLWHSVILNLLFRAPRWTKPLPLHDPENGTLFYVLLFLGVTLITVVLSTFTYRYVERPMIAVGNRIARRAAIRS